MTRRATKRTVSKGGSSPMFPGCEVAPPITLEIKAGDGDDTVHGGIVIIYAQKQGLTTEQETTLCERQAFVLREAAQAIEAMVAETRVGVNTKGGAS